MYHRLAAIVVLLVCGSLSPAGGQEPAAPAPTAPGYWCPMHPNVRSADAAAACADCGMALVAMPDRAGASFWLDVATEPAAVPVGRPVRLRIAVRDRETNAPVIQLEELHERPMHLFVIRSDLRQFQHVHPVPSTDGWFEVPLTFPRTGAYRIVADVLPTGAMPQMLQDTLLVGRPAPTLRPPPEPQVEVLEASDGDARAILTPSGARAGGDAHLRLEIVDRKSGAPASDLEPYLGAWGHMFLARHDLADVVHSHPLLDETTAGGPTVTFQTLFARSGWYRVWAQVQRRGRLLTFEFTLRVAEAA